MQTKKGFRLGVVTQLGGNLPDVLLATGLINILSLALPLALLQMYDRIIPNAAESTLFLLVLGVGAAVVFDTALRLGRSYITGWVGARFDHEAGCAAINAVFGSSASDFGREETGEHIERLASIAALKDFYSGQALLIIMDLPFVVAYLWLILFLGGWIVLVPLLMTVAFAISAWWVGRRLRREIEARSTADDRRLNFIIEVLGGIHTVKAMAMEAQMVRRYERLQASCAEANARVARHSTAAIDLSSFFSQATTIILVAFGSALVIENVMTMGALAACTMLAGRAIQPLQRATGMWTRFQTIRIAQRRLSQVFAMAPESRQGLPEMPRDITGALSLDHVSFRYGAKSPDIIRDITLDVAAGEMIGITGDNACGKTTLLWLIQGALEATGGIVRVDNDDITRFNPHSLRERIAYLPQHGVLFDGTIMDNLTMFRPELVPSALQVAAAMGLDQIVAHMPLGFETRVGDTSAESLPRGINQRIAIARALVPRPQIMLFDEANTAMDSAGDALLRDLLEKTKGRHTVIMVTVRPSLLALADRVFKLRGGTLVEMRRSS